MFSILHLQNWKSEIKGRLIPALKDDQLQRLHFSVNEFLRIDWEKDLHNLRTTENRNSCFAEGEFKHEGHMYDLVRLEVAGDGVVLICFNDSGESKLKTEIAIGLKDLSKRKQSFQFFAFCYIGFEVFTLPKIIFEKKQFEHGQSFHFQECSACVDRPPSWVV